jgi:arylsulfatase A
VRGRVEHEPAGSVDLLPTVCGLLGIAKPKGVHLDGSDLSPLLTGRANQFTRRQPLFWLLPTSNPVAAIRDGRYALVGYRNYELPQDRRAMAALFNRIAEIVGKGEEKSGEGNLRSRIFNTEFANPEAERLRIQYVQLNTFQESWIPLIKAGGFGRFELYDLAADPRQETDVSAQHPDIVARLKKQLLEINASVMADAPDWQSK